MLRVPIMPCIVSGVWGQNSCVVDEGVRQWVFAGRSGLDGRAVGGPGGRLLGQASHVEHGGAPRYDDAHEHGSRLRDRRRYPDRDLSLVCQQDRHHRFCRARSCYQMVLTCGGSRKACTKGIGSFEVLGAVLRRGPRRQGRDRQDHDRRRALLHARAARKPISWVD